MTFIRIDDRFMMEKARPWGIKGRSLYLAGLCYCNRELTDGIIPKNLVPLLLVEAEVTKATVTILTAAGAWIDEGDHYRVHDYLDWQRSREQAMKDRDRWRKQKQHQRDVHPDVHPRTEQMSTPMSAECPPCSEVIGGTTEVNTGTYILSVLSQPNELKPNRRSA